jgi:hypothetical protein
MKMTLVQSEDDVETLRELRNSCSNFLTGSQAYITPEAQSRWWKTRDPSVKIYLFGDPVVGFGYVTPRDGFNWTTHGLALEARGKGYGKEILRQVLKASTPPWKAEILHINTPAKKNALSLGFIEVCRSRFSAFGECSILEKHDLII